MSPKAVRCLGQSLKQGKLETKVRKRKPYNFDQTTADSSDTVSWTAEGIFFVV